MSKPWFSLRLSRQAKRILRKGLTRDEYRKLIHELDQQLQHRAYAIIVAMKVQKVLGSPATQKTLMDILTPPRAKWRELGSEDARHAPEPRR